MTWYQPITLDELLELKQSYPTARLVVGNTEVGIEVKFKAMEYSVLINPSRISELRQLKVTDNGIDVGAAVSVNILRHFVESLQQQGKHHPWQLRGVVAIKQMLSW